MSKAEKSGIKGLTEFFKGKSVALLGVGISNASLISFLSSLGVTLSLRDKRTPDPSLYEGTDAKLYFGEGYLDGLDEDIILKTPVIRPDVPELIKAERGGSLVTGEIELFLRFCPCKTFAVTGSDGKTTTAAVTAELLKTTGKTVFLGGNIGYPLLCRLHEIKEDDFAVVELSSFQLINCHYSPDTAIITNVTQNHLDWHTDMNEYSAAKCNIFKNEDASHLVLNADDPITASFKDGFSKKTSTFSVLSKDADAYLLGEKLYFKGERILDRSDIKLVGLHNVKNYLAAFLATAHHIKGEGLLKTARSFNGVAHRIEFIREKDGVKYYNSSIDTTPARTKAALGAFSDKLIVIAGGYDKKLSYEPLVETFDEHAKALILFGANTPKIKEVLKNKRSNYEIIEAESFEKTVLIAQGIAKNGDTVILSPASASFDHFKNFEQRGDLFKKLVNSL